VLTGRILRIEQAASLSVDVVLDVDGQHLRARITRDAAMELELAAGQEVFALIKSIALENTLFA
jgi:molybdate transport system ATP-binding protein